MSISDDDEDYDRRNGDNLSSIIEVASRDHSKATGSHDVSNISRGSRNTDIELGESDSDSDSVKTPPDDEDVAKVYWDCLDIRCFQEVIGDDGETRRKFKPTCGAYMVIFLVVFMISVWTGIGVVWRILLRDD